MIETTYLYGVIMNRSSLSSVITRRTGKSNKQVLMQRCYVLCLFACFVCAEGGKAKSSCEICLGQCMEARESNFNAYRCLFCLDSCINQTDDIFRFFMDHSCELSSTPQLIVPKTTTARTTTARTARTARPTARTTTGRTTTSRTTTSRTPTTTKKHKDILYDSMYISYRECQTNLEKVGRYFEDISLENQLAIEKDTTNFTVTSADMISANTDKRKGSVTRQGDATIPLSSSNGRNPSFRSGVVHVTPTVDVNTAVCPTTYRQISPAKATHKSDITVTLWNRNRPRQSFYTGECAFKKPLLSLNRTAACKTIDNFHRARYIIQETAFKAKNSPFSKDKCWPANSFSGYYVCYDWVKIPSSCGLFVT